VVDAYIPYRRSKASKRFGFVRFIKVVDVDRLVNNLCTMWGGRHKLQANILRFQREPLKRHSSLHNIDGVKRGNSGDAYNSNGVKGAANSYALIVKGSQKFKDGFGFEPSDVMKTWFSQIQLASSDFNADGRVTGKVFWVRAKEVPGWIPDFVEDNDEEEDSEVGLYEEVPNGEDVKNVEDL
nr:nucleotide-binding alpha-beta plait domain-containing protein [Tanacetum cinerariifolium]